MRCRPGAFTGRVFKQALRGRGQAAFTLVELMVASALRSFVAMANYTEMNQRSQLALDKMSKEIRQARQLTAFSTNSLTFANADGNPLSFTYTPNTRRLERVSEGQTNTLLSDCDSLQFSIYQHTMKSNSFDCYDVVTVADARVIQMNWKSSRDILGKKATTESVQSAKIVIRNH